MTIDSIDFVNVYEVDIFISKLNIIDMFAVHNELFYQASWFLVDYKFIKVKQHRSSSMKPRPYLDQWLINLKFQHIQILNQISILNDSKK